MTPIKIGCSLSLTGVFEEFGQSIFLAHKIWVEKINKSGGLLGRQVELVYMDDKSSTYEALKVYSKLMDVEKVNLVIGGYGSIVTSAVTPLISKKHKFFISLMSKANNDTNCFSMIPVGDKPDTVLTEYFFKSLPKNSSVAIIAADSECTVNSVAGAKENLIKNSHRHIFDYHYSLTNLDFNKLAQELKRLKPDAVYIAAYSSESLGVIKAINDIEFSPKKVGVSVVQQLGLKNMYNGVDEVMEQYLSRTSTIEADTIGYCIAPQAYAQLQVVEAAIKATNSLDNHHLIGYTREAVFKTVLGDIKFNEYGECMVPEMQHVQYQAKMTETREVISL